MTSSTPASPLAGLRVVVASGEIATRYCGRLVSVLGAAVAQVAVRSAAEHEPALDEHTAEVLAELGVSGHDRPQ